jgi:diketogulonate reductase-like aldo/keto reductase
MQASTSSTPPTCTPAARARRSSGRPLPADTATTCYFPVEGGPLAVDPPPTPPPRVGATTSGRVRRASGGSVPTGSICTRCTGPDYHTDIDETLAALSDLVRRGKVRAIGSSSFPASAIVEAQWVAERRGRARTRCEQPQYSILVRGIELDVLPTCARYGMGVIVLSPLNAGWLSGMRQRDAEASGVVTRRWKLMPGLFDLEDGDTATKFALVEELEALTGELGLSLPHLALAWTLEHPAVTSAIIGPRTVTISPA